MGDASVTSWRMWIRGRSLRPGRADNDEDEFQLDPNKDHAENLRDILTNICKKQGITSERKRLSYLNAFVKLLTKCEHDYSKLGFTAEEILYCLRPALLHDTTQVRSGGLRAMRYMLRTKHEAAISYRLQYPLLVARSLDLITGNDNERVQAMRVVRRLMCLDAAQFPVCLARTLVAIASGTDDRLINVTLGALAELCVLNAELFISVGGVTTILRSLACVRSARMAEALIGSLLYLQNKPRTRLRAGLNLDCLAAPYTDLQHTSDRPKESQGPDRLKWPHVTLLSTLRSWPGVLHFCHPLKDGLRSIVATLYLNQLDVRKAVVDLLYELLCLAQPEWSDEMSVALEAVDPSRTQDAFKLSEGFVAAEGKAVLPHLSKCRVNLSELHLSLLLYCFLEVGLLDAIVEVIIAEDTFLSVRATILLGELLHLIHLLLPPECCHLTPSLPNLLSYAVRGRPHSTERKDYSSPPPPPPVNSRMELPSKMDIIAMTMGVRSGVSSVRTVSESSTERGTKPEPLTNQKQSSEGGAEKRNASENKLKSREPTSHLLKDVREVLVDMTNAEVKSPRKRRTRDDSVSFSTEPAIVEPPACSRAQQKAMAAVTTLSQLHRLLRQCPAPASVNLDHVLASVTGRSALEGVELARAKGKTQSKNKLNQVLIKECDEAIKDSQVLTNKDCFAWNWDIIRAILRSRPECLRKLDDNNHRQFFRRLVNFVMPTSNQMSRVDFSTDRRIANSYTLTAMELLDCLLLASDDSECDRLLTELLTGVKVQFDAISSGKSAHDCMFSPQAVGNSVCQDYFLLAGHLTRSRKGCDIMDKLGILHTLLVLATSSKHDCYVKLIISSLDYSSDQRTRNIMASTLVCPQESSRLYATKFLRVLLRTPLSKRGDYARWVIELLANQLSDEDRAVSLTAVNALDEACDCKEYLEALIDLRPSLLHLGDKGLLLLIRFLSTEKGFSYMSEANFVSTQLAKWVKFNYKYVCIVEGELADGLTLVERNEDGRYSSRLSNNKRMPIDVYVPPHLYGQLARHSAGLSAVMADDNVPKLLQVVLRGQCSTDAEILELKAALWALGHLSSCSGGALWARAYSLTRAVVSLACTSPVYSVRATAFHSIALTASCVEGADTLRALGWHSVRHNRNQHWPVVAPLSLLEDALLLYQDCNQTSDSSESTTTETVTKNGLFILGEDTSMDGTESFSGFTAREKTARERKSATLPPAGSSHTYHHNRSYSESKADGSEWRSNTPAPSHSGSDITDCRSQEHPRLYSESSTSSGGESSQPRTYFSDRVIQTLSPIPSSGSLATVSRRRVSVASSQGPQLSPKDMLGLAALRTLHHSRRPTFATPNLTFHFPQSAPTSLSPLSPIELIAFQDWRQMSPLVRPRHPDNHHVEPQFEVSGPHCVLPGDSHSSGRTLHYESSRAYIAPPPEDPEEEDGEGPCFQGICLPQNLVDLFPMEEISVNAEDPLADNASTTGMDLSSCDSETDTAPEAEAERVRPRAPPKRRHDHASCLLCCVSRLATNKQTRRRKLSASSQHRTRTETESSYGGAGNDGESPVMLPWQVKGGLEGITSVDSSSTDITSSVAQRSMGDNFKSRSVIRKEILRMAEQLCNPILYKTCKTALLQLKQIYSDVFNDICVYSDVCAVMSSASHRIYARRFLQELFLDAPFSELYEDPLGILSGQNNTEGEEGGCSEKLLIGAEAATSEELTSDPNSWKNSTTKMNGFDPDQRVGQGFELEVIMESDARSESSDHCRGRSSTLGSITPGEPRPSSSPVTSVEPEAQSESNEQILGYGSNLIHETRPSTSPTTSTEPLKAQGCKITVSKSSQQLRKEFFNATLSPTVHSEKETKSEKTSVERKSEDCAITVAESISTSKNMIDYKLKGDARDKITATLSTSSKLCEGFEKGEKRETKMKKKTKEENVPENAKKICEPSVKSVGKSKNGSNEHSPPVSNTNKSPLLAKKGKKLSPVNTKPSNVPSKIETATPKTTIEQLTAILDIELSQENDCMSHSIKKEVKLEPAVGKKDTKSQPKDSLESGSDASTSSKNVLKNNKSKINDAITTGKPPSGSGRQRKKSTTKTPNRESLDAGRKKSDSESGSR